MIGYRNVSKCANKIVLLEREGVIPSEEMFSRIADALDITFPTVEALVERDRQDELRAWEAWVAEPAPMTLTARLVAGVWASIPLPDHVTTPAQAEAYACDFAKQKRWKVCLSLSRRHAIWITEEGVVNLRLEATPDRPNGPWMALGKHRKRFLPRMEPRTPNE